MPKSCGSIAEILKQNGYNTAWFGKNHNVPDWQSSQTGPFDLWPTGLGFEHFYGFIGGDTDQWFPALYDGTQPIQTPAHDPKYHMDADIADHAIAWIQQQHSLAPDKPFFAYYAPGLAHAPHHAPKEWIAKFKGQFDQGWDKEREETLARQIQLGVVPAGTKLTPRPDAIPAWDSLSADQKKLYAHMIEVYAACLSYCDYNIGRVIQSVKDSGELDNTIIIYIQGDNGASAEGTLQGSGNEIGVAANGVPESLDYLLSVMDELGGPMLCNHYPVGWAHAMGTPFQWTKQVASHFGGTRNGMVISWPKRMKQTGEVRSQFCSVIDIAPTILEATGIKEPKMINGVKQKPMEGTSLVYSFGDADAPTHHHTQYFEMFGNRGIYQDGWMANTTPLRVPREMTGPSPSPDDFKWELYHVAEDFSQANNLAAQNPAKLKELQGVFDHEAKKYNVHGYVTHMTLHAPDGFDEIACRALSKLRKVWGMEGFDVRIVLLATGQPNDFFIASPYFRKSKTWISLTPYVPVRHPKATRSGMAKNDDKMNGLQIGSPEHDCWWLLEMVAAELPVTSVTLSDEQTKGTRIKYGLRDIPCLDFQRDRRTGDGTRAGNRG